MTHSPLPTRPRARQAGLATGRLPPGRYNTLTDVAGVRVGHTTLISGDGPLRPGHGPVRTGVTVILPHDQNIFQHKVPAAVYTINGYGKALGFEQVRELGTIESPIALTNTLNVGLVADALVDYAIRNNPDIGIRTSSVNVIVGETNDGYLNDLQGRHVRAGHVGAALEAASAGPVAEGNVGAGTGVTCFGWKGGIGTASRIVPQEAGGFVVGVLAQANFGNPEDLLIGGVSVGRTIRPPADAEANTQVRPYEAGSRANTPVRPYEAGSEANTPVRPYEAGSGANTPVRPYEAGSGANTPVRPYEAGSVMLVLATDAPLDARQLQRLCVRAAAGLARTGSVYAPGSGDFVIAFSTAGRVEHRPKALVTTQAVLADEERVLSWLFLAVAEGVEEAVINALCAAQTMVGRDGHTRYALPVDAVAAFCAKSWIVCCESECSPITRE